MEIVSPIFQLVLLTLSAIVITCALYWRLHNHTSLDPIPPIISITPSTLKKFGSTQNKVKAGLYINQFQTFNMMNNDFIFNGVVWFELNHDTISLDTLEKFTIEKGDIIKRSPAESQILKDKLLVRYNVTIKFTSSLNYQDFPFDSHELFIYLTLPSVTPSEIIFESSLEELQIAPEVSTHGWKLINKNVIVGYNCAELELYHEEKTLNYPAVVFSLSYRRYGIRFVLLITLPILFVFYLSLFSFSIENSSTSISIVVGTISTILSYRFVIEKLSPETGYFLISDYLFFLFLFSSFFVFLLNVIENFSFTNATITQKKIVLSFINTTVTLIALYILIMKEQKSIYLLKQTLRSGKKWFFNTINDMQIFAQTMPEYPHMDNTDLQHPDYSTFYKGYLPNPIIHFVTSLFGKKIDAMPGNFVTLLTRVIEYRETADNKGYFATQISLKNPAHFIVWDDLHASFHSLYRSLEWLKQNNYIRDDFTLMHNETYLVFNGNCIDQGAYNLETLYIILKLMSTNPDRIIYTRGLHEDAAYWQNYTLKQELTIRARHLSDTLIPFNDLFLRFFNTLPTTLYIDFMDHPTETLRISNQPTFEFDETMTGSFFVAPTKPMSHFNYDHMEESKAKIDVKAVIKTESLMHKNNANKGLVMLEQDRGATAWSIISARTKIMQKEYSFHYDAFILLQVNEPISNSTLSLINRNINTNAPFEQHGPLNIITGSTKINKPIKSEIYIGSSMALKGGILEFVGKSIQDGISSCVNTINKAGGIEGHHIKTTIYSDDYTPYLAHQNINRLIQQDNTDLIVLPVGGPTLYSYIDLIREHKVTVLFPVTGAPQFRNPELTSLINLRASSTNEVHASINYLCDAYDITKFAFFYQDDPFEPIEAAHQILQQRGINSWVDIPHQRASTDFSEQIKILKVAQPEAIGFFTSAFSTQEFIRQIGVEHLTNKKLFAFAFTAEESIRTFAQQHGLDLLFSSVVPNPHMSNLEIVQEYRKAMDANFYTYDNFSLEAYIGTSLLIEILQQLEGPPFSRQRILEALESLNGYAFKGLTLTFNPNRRNLSPSVWLETKHTDQWLEIPWTELQKSLLH